MGHDVLWTGDLPSDPGDREILAWAQREHRVLITLDKDFGGLAVRLGQSHHGIIRIIAVRASQQGPILYQVLSRYGEELARGALITGESGRIRIRLLD